MELNGIIKAIEERVSVRTYRRQPLSEAHMRAIKAFIAQQPKPPFGTDIRYVITGMDSGYINTFSAYGIIRGAETYIACVLPPGGRICDLGYSFEQVVLYAQQMGIGTCWLGGTFNRRAFSRAAELKEGEILPVVSPLGYPANQPGLTGRTFRALAGSAKRLPFETLFFDGGFNRPLTEAEAGDDTRALRMVRLGPSASNHQPWRIVKDGNDRYHFYIQRTKRYIGTIFGFDMQMIDIGIAMCHLELSLRARGIFGSFYSNNPDIPIPEEKKNRMEYVVSFRKGNMNR